jgi:hypothetical protein
MVKLDTPFSSAPLTRIILIERRHRRLIFDPRSICRLSGAAPHLGRPFVRPFQQHQTEPFMSPGNRVQLLVLANREFRQLIEAGA